jgi:hypothetical protein
VLDVSMLKKPQNGLTLSIKIDLLKLTVGGKFVQSKRKRSDELLEAEILLAIREILLKYTVKLSQANRVLEKFNFKVALRDGKRKKAKNP